MEDIIYVYAQCGKGHPNLGGYVDGCQEFIEDCKSLSICKACGCHKNFHRRVKAPAVFKTVVVYSKCQRIHDFTIKNSFDGCQEFTPSSQDGTTAALTCAVCGCHRGFHKKDVTNEFISTSD